MSAKKLGHTFFRHVQEKTTEPSLLKSMLRSLDSGLYAVPKSFQVLSRFPSEELKLNYPKPPQHRSHEHKMMKALLARYPELRYEPVALNSPTPALARQMLEKQQKLQRTGMSSEKSASLSEDEFLPRLRDLRRSSGMAGTHLGLIQQEEELQLRAALDHVATRSAAGSGGGKSGQQ